MLIQKEMENTEKSRKKNKNHLPSQKKKKKKNKMRPSSLVWASG